jgi:hypothetical protein
MATPTESPETQPQGFQEEMEPQGFQVDALPPIGSGDPLEKQPFAGRHFSDAKITSGVLSGTRRGASGVGAEAARFNAGRGAAPGVYVYREGSVAEPQIASRKNEYRVVGDKSLLAVESPIWQRTFEAAMEQYSGDARAAINETEHTVRDIGYDGYFSEKSPGIVFLYGDQTIQPLGNETPFPSLTSSRSPRGNDLSE